MGYEKDNMLTERRRQVLEALVSEYIAYATPVGSHTLVERYNLDFSPATVRNELANLEKTGYLASPHTSSGRIPTDAGYRIFVDSILDDDTECKDVSELNGLSAKADEFDEFVKRTCSFLSKMTDCLSVVLAPSLERVSLKRLSVVPLTTHDGLVVIVTNDGKVVNRHISFGADVEPERLASIERLFNNIFAGLSRQEMCGTTHEEILDAAHDPLAALILDETIDMLVEHSTEQVRHLGVSSLLAQPEFAESRHAIPLVMLLEDDDMLVSLLDAIETDDSIPTVRIGHELKNKALNGISIVSKGYKSDGAQGLVSVIGPTRMDYAKAIPAVDRVSRIFERTL